MINFLRFRWVYFFISLIIIGVGLFSVIRWGYVYSIDFVGGANLEYQVDGQIKKDEIVKVLKEQKVDLVDLTVTKNSFLIRTRPLAVGKENQIQTSLEKQLGKKLTTLRVETVGPTLGRETIRKTIIASLIGLVGILLYITFAFKGLTFALAAIVALLHDVLVVVGMYSLISHFLGAQVDTLFVTALLTTMSFSVHDTIVIFDKIREHNKTKGRENIAQNANRALTETLVRSINNSMTIIFMLIALILLGGSTIKFFVVALLIGTITGTYSSPFVATPIVVWLEKLRKK